MDGRTFRRRIRPRHGSRNISFDVAQEPLHQIFRRHRHFRARHNFHLLYLYRVVASRIRFLFPRREIHSRDRFYGNNERISERLSGRAREPLFRRSEMGVSFFCADFYGKHCRGLLRHKKWYRKTRQMGYADIIRARRDNNRPCSYSGSRRPCPTGAQSRKRTRVSLESGFLAA